jgi:hypothetical protein
VARKGHGVERVERVFVGQPGDDQLADLRLPGLHRALDLVRLEQRAVGVHGDLELAAGGRIDLLGELLDVLGVEVAGRIRGGHVPRGLGLCGGGDADPDQRCGDRLEEGMQERHGEYS